MTRDYTALLGPGREPNTQTVQFRAPLSWTTALDEFIAEAAKAGTAVTKSDVIRTAVTRLIQAAG